MIVTSSLNWNNLQYPKITYNRPKKLPIVENSLRWNKLK